MTREPDGGESSIPFKPCGCIAEGSARWFCIYTESGAETAVEKQLKHIGLTAWYPRFAGANRLQGVFPRYVFAQFDLSEPGWPDIYRTPGVVTIMGVRGNRPSPIRLGFIPGLWGDCAPDGVFYPRSLRELRRYAGREDLGPVKRLARYDDPRGDVVIEELSLLDEGILVDVVDGPFTSFQGIVEASTAKRVDLLLSMFGRETRVSLDRGAVALAA